MAGRTVTCSLGDCIEAPLYRGLCRRHYRLWLNARGRSCGMVGCDDPSYARGLCVMHYTRLRRAGRAGTSERIRGRHGEGSVTRLGYRVHCRPSHPLARAQGKVFEHRVVLFDRIGPGSHPCHWCGRRLDWEPPDDGAALLVADHLDGDGLNNQPENLVPSCIPCNATREQAS